MDSPDMTMVPPAVVGTDLDDRAMHPLSTKFALA